MNRNSYYSAQVVVSFARVYNVCVPYLTGDEMMLFFRIQLLLLLFLNGCMATLPQTPEPPAGTYRLPTSITYKLLQRTFLLHIPTAYISSQALPLVVVLHGAFSTGKQMEEETGFSLLADKERFLVAYPEGIGIFGLLQHWNAGHCCGKAADDKIDDVGFIAEVIESISQKLAVDSSRIYLAGMSNGGMLTYRFAAERADILAAAAVVSGAIGSSVGGKTGSWQLEKPVRAVPMIVFHGLSDTTIPVTGNASTHSRGERSYSSVAEAKEFWRSADGCGVEPATVIGDNDAVKRQRWDNCRDISSVEYNLLAGWGHQWPAPWFTAGLAEGSPLRGFDATKKIWDFLSRFRRSESCEVNQSK